MALHPTGGPLPGGGSQLGLASLLGQNFPQAAAPGGLAASPAAGIPAIMQLFNLLAAAQGGLPPQAQVQPQPALAQPLALPSPQAPQAQAPTAAPGAASTPRPFPTPPALPNPRPIGPPADLGALIGGPRR